MKKAQIYRRLASFWRMTKDFFVEEEPRDRARRTMREASRSLNRIVYQRIVLEHELKNNALGEPARQWCERNLELIRKCEQETSARLRQLREQYRTLMMQDLYYSALNDPAGEAFEEAQQAIVELEASVEAERTIRTMPRYLPNGMLPQLDVAHDEDCASAAGANGHGLISARKRG